ncbi:hypothetical protein K449DRAFT_379668 [Hypoxylon sp. EC38]|nr:hypothetical protein K449DRAFT_379668 [Hypoxylon sp. EC38]
MDSPANSRLPVDSLGGKLSATSFSRILRGVTIATKLTENITDEILQVLGVGKSGYDNADVVLPFKSWQTVITTRVRDQEQRNIAIIALAITYLRELYNEGKTDPCQAVSETNLSTIWELIHGALIDTSPVKPLWVPSRSAQGFLSVPLCSLIKNGNIDELFRLHVWLPDSHRGNKDVAIHSHQAAAQSWILAGEGVDHSYEVESVDNPEAATHSEYSLLWNDGKTLDTNYKTHQTSSTIINNGKLVRVKLVEKNLHGRGMSYVIPEARYHVTEVDPDAFHATLFVFDSHRGFVQDAGILGPKDGDSFTQLRDPAGMEAEHLAQIVNAVRDWEKLMDQGQRHIDLAEWEYALGAFNRALILCNYTNDFPNRTYHKNIVLHKLGRVNRCFGRYGVAKEILEGVISDVEISALRVHCSGELGVIYRHLSLLAEARDAFEMQYKTAKQLGLESETCRAIGNLGMVNYQISQQDQSSSLLNLAMAQLRERIQRAQSIRQSLSQSSGPGRSSNMRDAAHWEIIGLSRLCLCLVAQGNIADAIQAAQESLALSLSFGDSTVIAMTRFFYGHAFLIDGQLKDASKQFNAYNGCTPAIALCKEPSRENREYLRELIDSGVDLDVVDDHGYTALDYAVFNSDDESEALVLKAVEDQVGSDGAKQRLYGAKLRKAYRELFQERLRPVLLAGGLDCIAKLRSVYANSLATNEGQSNMFVGYSFVPYSTFSRLGRLPRFEDGSAQQASQDGCVETTRDSEYNIFFSYRWAGNGSGSKMPDDEQNTQYNRMLCAVEQFLELQPHVGREKLGVWIDYACIDQDDPLPGAHSLPLLLVQCDAVISLVDDSYFDRAWCSVEALLVQTLKKSYGVHLWYQQVCVPLEEGPGDSTRRWTLTEGPMDDVISIAEKSLSFEEIDRPKVMFLERQSKLLA